MHHAVEAGHFVGKVDRSSDAVEAFERERQFELRMHASDTVRVADLAHAIEGRDVGSRRFDCGIHFMENTFGGRLWLEAARCRGLSLLPRVSPFAF